jgi:hypothetical protein
MIDVFLLKQSVRNMPMASIASADVSSGADALQVTASLKPEKQRPLATPRKADVCCPRFRHWRYLAIRPTDNDLQIQYFAGGPAIALFVHRNGGDGSREP